MNRIHRLALFALFIIIPACGYTETGEPSTDGDIVHCFNTNKQIVPCGGSCGATCSANDPCLMDIDCKSGLVCIGAKCAPLPVSDLGVRPTVDATVPTTCSDGVQNGSETDVDCGGSCGSTCADGANCKLGADCVSGQCINSVCVPKPPTYTCNNGVKDGTETDVDCGGTCPPCADDQHCMVAADCMSGYCLSVGEVGGTCVSFAVHDGGVPSTDSGPMASDASPMPVDAAVVFDQSVAPTCYDGIQNGNETDVDCGGGTCVGCDTGKACNAWLDCWSGVCTNNRCQAATCSDGVQNGYESDIDCGGGFFPCGSSCPVGKKCYSHVDCISDNCVNFICEPMPDASAPVDLVSSVDLTQPSVVDSSAPPEDLAQPVDSTPMLSDIKPQPADMLLPSTVDMTTDGAVTDGPSMAGVNFLYAKPSAAFEASCPNNGLVVETYLPDANGVWVPKDSPPGAALDTGIDSLNGCFAVTTRCNGVYHGNWSPPGASTAGYFDTFLIDGVERVGDTNAICKDSYSGTNDYKIILCRYSRFICPP